MLLIVSGMVVSSNKLNSIEPVTSERHFLSPEIRIQTLSINEDAFVGMKDR
jgi:hypothetical protein